MTCRGLPERHTRRGGVAQQKAGLSLRRGRVVRALTAGSEQLEHATGQLSRPLRIAAEQAQRGGVDRRVVAPGTCEDRAVGRGGAPGLVTSSLAGGGERHVL